MSKKQKGIFSIQGFVQLSLGFKAETSGLLDY